MAMNDYARAYVVWQGATLMQGDNLWELHDRRMTEAADRLFSLIEEK